MKDKKKKNVVIIILQITIIMLQIVIIGLNNKDIKLDKVKLKEIAAYDNSNVSIMIYNNDKNEYEKYTGESFPSKSEYVYSEEDSKCLDVNGTIIENAIKYFNGKVTIKTNKTSTCYLSFRPGKALTFELGEGVAKVYYKVNNDEEYIESNETTIVAVTPGTEYTYYGEAETGYVLSACTSEEDTCSGTMPNEAKTETISAGRFRIKANTGVGEIYYKLSSETNYTNSLSTATINESSGTYEYYGLPSVGYKVSTCNEANPCTVTIEPGVYETTITAETITNTNGATYLINLAESNTTTNLIKQTGLPTTAQTGSNATTDYRYIGASDVVNNYVCLGNLQSNGQCEDNEHLYRIIGVIPTQTTKTGSYENRIKLIKKATYVDNNYSMYGGIRWTGKTTPYYEPYISYSGSTNVNPNNWEESILNRVVLNQTYYNSLDEVYQEMIGNSVWYLGGREDSSVPVSTIYTSERSNTVCSTSNSCKNAVGINPTYAERKIGLMYASDYGYATSGGSTTNRSTCLTTSLGSWDGSGVTDCKLYNWLLNDEEKLGMFTISNSIHDYDSCLAIIDERGFVGESDVNNYKFIFPVFNLNIGIKIISGTGSINSPYTISS